MSGHEMVPVLTGTGRYLPDRAWTSAEVEARLNEASGPLLPRGVIRFTTGVAERRFAADEVSSDLAAFAARRALRAAGVEATEVDLLIFASASHDVSEPATANIVQTKVGCHEAAALDVKNACNSFLNGLDIAAAFISTSRARTVLVAAGECLSGTIKWTVSADELPRRTAALTLGDGGGACVVQARSGESGIFPGRFRSSGEMWACSTVLAGGTALGMDEAHRYFECDSAALQRRAVSALPPLIEAVLAERGWRPDELALVVPHQVSSAVTRKVAQLAGIPIERCVMTLDRFGNTAAASIPIALDIALEEGRVARGDKVLLVGGAAGFSGGVIPLVL